MGLRLTLLAIAAALLLAGLAYWASGGRLVLFFLPLVFAAPLAWLKRPRRPRR